MKEPQTHVGPLVYITLYHSILFIAEICTGMNNLSEPFVASGTYLRCETPILSGLRLHFFHLVSRRLNVLISASAVAGETFENYFTFYLIWMIVVKKMILKQLSTNNSLPCGTSRERTAGANCCGDVFAVQKPPKSRWLRHIGDKEKGFKIWLASGPAIFIKKKSVLDRFLKS